jgi:DNA polymerase-3 subunit chi
MTRVDFYILPGSNPHDRRIFACKLTEKAWRQGMNVYIHTGSDSETEILDKLLWTFRQGSFIPHQKATASAAQREEIKVLIGSDGAPAEFRDVLVNLSQDFPPDFEHYQRVAELVDDEPTVRAEGRKRYAAYKQQGHELDTHKL